MPTTIVAARLLALMGESPANNRQSQGAELQMKKKKKKREFRKARQPASQPAKLILPINPEVLLARASIWHDP